VISSISGSSGTSPAVSLTKAKEAALQGQIDTDEAKAQTTSCSDTAKTLSKDVAKLKAQLAALQFSSATSANHQTKNLKTSTRYLEFSDDNTSAPGNGIPSQQPSTNAIAPPRDAG
jgi:hypothetical protein